MKMAVLKDSRSFRPFKSSEEYLVAMTEDLAEWFHLLYPDLLITADNFLDRLDTGVALCKHANAVRKSAEEYLARRAARKMSTSTSMTSSTISPIALPITSHGNVPFLRAAKPGTFFARDNVSNFIDWCRRGLGIIECLLFETDDLIMRKNEKHVILCLLEVARRGARFGMPAPLLVQLEREIDREIAADQRALQRATSYHQHGEGYESEEEEDEDDEEEDQYNVQYGPMPQIVTNDLKSLDEMVRDLVERCRCPVQFPMIRVSEGKYRIGDTKVLIFVRILRNHVMVRVGGGWDTLSHYLDKHDPCRCKTAHRATVSAKLILKHAGAMELNHAQVHYDRSPPRTRRSSASSIGSVGRSDSYHLTPPTNHPVNTRSRSPTPRRNSMSTNNNNTLSVTGGRSTPNRNRSRSPTPRRSLQPLPRNRSPSPNPQPPRRKAVMSEPATTGRTADNDSGSEVSDEGYRSLGLIAGQARDEALSKRASFSSFTCHDELDSCCSPMNVDQHKQSVVGKENNPLPDLLDTRRMSSPRSRSTPPRPSTQPTTTTWTSRGNQRPAASVTTPSKSPGLGARHSYQRSSLGSRPRTNPTSLTTSPTRQVSPLVQQILDVKDLGDDAKVLDKMKEIIKHYKDIVDERLVEEDSVSKIPELDFTSTWVHNSGAIHGGVATQHGGGATQHGGGATQLLTPKQAAPRKDSKVESFTSRIPAPVSYRPTCADSS